MIWATFTELGLTIKYYKTRSMQRNVRQPQTIEGRRVQMGEEERKGLVYDKSIDLKKQSYCKLGILIM